jgi:hypothetical protein
MNLDDYLANDDQWQDDEHWSEDRPLYGCLMLVLLLAAGVVLGVLCIGLVAAYRT